MLKEEKTFPEQNVSFYKHHQGLSIFQFNVQLAEQYNNMAQKQSFTLPFKLQNYQSFISALRDSEFPEMDAICIISFLGNEPGLKTRALLHFMNFIKLEKLSCTSELQSCKNPTGDEPDAFHFTVAPVLVQKHSLQVSRTWVVLLCLLSHFYLLILKYSNSKF